MLTNLLFVNLFDLLFFGTPVAVFILFFISLALYLFAKNKEKRSPGSVSKRTLSARAFFLAFTTFLALPMLLLVIGYILLLIGAIAFM